MAIRRPSPQTRAVLHELAEQAPAWSHGYDLCRTLGLKPGTMYPILIRLTEQGLVEATWEADPPRGRPPRHLYRLSSEGAEMAARLAADAADAAVAPGGPARRPGFKASPA